MLEIRSWETECSLLSNTIRGGLNIFFRQHHCQTAFTVPSHRSVHTGSSSCPVLPPYTCRVYHPCFCCYGPSWSTDELSLPACSTLCKALLTAIVSNGGSRSHCSIIEIDHRCKEARYNEILLGCGCIPSQFERALIAVSPTPTASVATIRDRKVI